jgi:hypothetical protein
MTKALICPAAGISTRLQRKILQIPSVTVVCTDSPSLDKLLYVIALEGRIDIIVNLKPRGKAAYRITIMITTA